MLVTEPLPIFQKELKRLEQFATIKYGDSVKSRSGEDYLCDLATDVDVIVVGLAKISKKVIYSAKNLRGIVRCGIGVDNIDVNAATERGVPVVFIPDYCIGAVADHTFALLLALARGIVRADKMVRKYGCGEPPPELRGVELEGKVLGVIGLGRIGRAVVERARGFGLKVIAYDPYVDKEAASSLGVKLVDLNTLLKQSDFVTIHTPLTEETRGLIGINQLKLMKKTAYLINVSRGGIVDEKALYEALKEKWIAGAALDVFEKEPCSPDNPLFTLDNIVVTPHIAWFTEEAGMRLAQLAIDEAIRIIKGERPRFVANPEVLKMN